MQQSRKDKKELKEIRNRFKEIDQFFAEMAKDKSLPTFGEFFMLCLVLGTAESVNLKTMYPRAYSKVSAFYNKHNAFIAKLKR